MRMLHFLLMPVAGAWRRHRVGWGSSSVLDGLFSLLFSCIHFTMLLLLFVSVDKGLYIDPGCMVTGSTDILSISNYYRGNPKTITLGQPPILCVSHETQEIEFIHWGKYIKKRSLHDGVFKNLVKYVFLHDYVLLWCGVHPLLGSLVLCLSASMFFCVLCLEI